MLFKKRHILSATVGLLCFTGCHITKSSELIPTEDVRNEVVGRIIKEVSSNDLNNIDENFIQTFITPEERKAFAKNHWRFTVNKPALVSIMRDKNQKTVPFWLLEAGFIHTGKTVRNQHFEYEVWQKEVSEGEICLGINGFDLHRPVYFVTIGPVENGDMPAVTHVYPDKWKRIKMQKGAFTYNDWDELTIEEFPAEMEGHLLFTTIRGRAREAAIINSFRATAFPASKQPDQIVLTWSDEPSTTQSIQWRTSASVTGGVVKYWDANQDSLSAKTALTSSFLLRDVYIYNEPDVKHWEATITSLHPQTTYKYQIISENGNEKSPVYTFKTTPGKSAPFKFIFIGDTHNHQSIQPVIEKAMKDCPDAALLVHSGDHVNTGLFRDQWDEYFHYMRNVLPYISFVPALGNHDSQDGLPPELFKQLFLLPGNERNFTFAYSNVRFFILDSTGDTDSIALWLEKELEKSTELWKIAVTHFPPYYQEDSYLEKREKWCSLFDTYGVDLVLSGHIHQYFRSYPIYNNQPQNLDGEGAIYVASVAVESRDREQSSSKYNVLHVNTGSLYQVVEIDENKLKFTAKDTDGKIIDSFHIHKIE